jgi:FlaA1/EpsC-like NDP-sugar epimerase
MVRYFMTIPEAVQLVCRPARWATAARCSCSTWATVRVLDLARDLIRLSGLAEDDVQIRFTGMRPGEKLYEELFFNEENASPTEHAKVLRARNAALGLSGPDAVSALIVLARRNAPADELRRRIHALVPEYTGAAPVAAAPERAPAPPALLPPAEPPAEPEPRTYAYAR